VGVARLDHVVIAVSDYETDRGRYAYRLSDTQQPNVHGCSS
jgi:translation initiation factor IF-1